MGGGRREEENRERGGMGEVGEKRETDGESLIDYKHIRKITSEETKYP